MPESTLITPNRFMAVWAAVHALEQNVWHRVDSYLCEEERQQGTFTLPNGRIIALIASTFHGKTTQMIQDEGSDSSVHVTLTPQGEVLLNRFQDEAASLHQFTLIEQALGLQTCPTTPPRKNHHHYTP